MSNIFVSFLGDLFNPLRLPAKVLFFLVVYIFHDLSEHTDCTPMIQAK